MVPAGADLAEFLVPAGTDLAVKLLRHCCNLQRYQPMAPQLPMVPRKVPMVRFGGAMAGLPVWGGDEDASKHREIKVYWPLVVQNLKENTTTK